MKARKIKRFCNKCRKVTTHRMYDYAHCIICRAASVAKYRKTKKGKETTRIYNASEKARAARREYMERPEWVEYYKAWHQRDEKTEGRKKKRAAYKLTPKAKEAHAKWRKTPIGKETHRRFLHNRTRSQALKWLQFFEKNPDIATHVRCKQA